jgi:hypothetical protein
MDQRSSGSSAMAAMVRASSRISLRSSAVN